MLPWDFAALLSILIIIKIKVLYKRYMNKTLLRERAAVSAKKYLKKISSYKLRTDYVDVIVGGAGHGLQRSGARFY